MQISGLGKQRIVARLVYADAPAAIDFLCKAFGFRERFRYAEPDGRVGHAELIYADNMVALSSVYEGFGESPLKLPATASTLHCYVDDLDEHYAHARDHGATITMEPVEDHGMRFYRATDLEGHRWVFAKELSQAKAS
jgi:uncharacterized glyoxalase superfamily protein PhnB